VKIGKYALTPDLSPRFGGEEDAPRYFSMLRGRAETRYLKDTGFPGLKVLVLHQSEDFAEDDDLFVGGDDGSLDL
jgi:hypothetical protein